MRLKFEKKEYTFGWLEAKFNSILRQYAYRWTLASNQSFVGEREQKIFYRQIENQAI